MRHLIIASLLASLPWSLSAAPTWQVISSEPGKRIEIDRTNLKREGTIVQAQGRVVLEKELIDGRSGAGYRVIEAITRYDCTTRNATTIKRIFKKNETDIVREEDIKGAELPVRSGTLDDKVLREVCRPPRENQAELAKKANEAGNDLKAANDAMLKKGLAKAEKPAALKASETPAKEDAIPVPSIRPNLKAAADAAREASPTSPPSPAAKPVTPPPAKAQTYIIHAAPAAKPKKASRPEGYMLELTHSEPAVQHAHIHWGYEGAGAPENWSKLDPQNKACAIGERQSPIDIKDGIKVDLEPIKFNYQPSTFRIVDNGHTVQVQVGEGSISLTGKSYELVQFHFHRPSEEKINGQRFDMVVHLGTKPMTASWRWSPCCSNAATRIPSSRAVELHATGKEHAGFAAQRDRRPEHPATDFAQLLHLHGFADHAALLRGCAVAGDEAARPGIAGTDQHLQPPVPQQRPPHPALQRPPDQGRPLT